MTKKDKLIQYLKRKMEFDIVENVTTELKDKINEILDYLEEIK